MGDFLDGDNTLSAAEKQAARMTFKATMLRAADIVERITADDVLLAQAELLSTGSTLEQVAKIDRAMLAATHLRACANGTVKK